MSQKDRARWDAKWRERRAGEQAAAWLVRHRELFHGGIAADLATGRGADAIWLTQHGYRVLAVDGSLIALQQARQRAARAGARDVVFVQADLDHFRLPSNAVDLITVFRFLDRSLFAMIRDAVRPGGLVVYQTRTIRWLEREPGACSEYLLRPGELRQRFVDWELLAYEEAAAGAAIVARRPPSA